MATSKQTTAKGRVIRPFQFEPEGMRLYSPGDVFENSTTCVKNLAAGGFVEIIKAPRTRKPAE